MSAASPAAPAPAVPAPLQERLAGPHGSDAAAAPVRGVSSWPLPLPTRRAARLVAAGAAFVVAGALHPLVAWAGVVAIAVVLVGVVFDYLAAPRAASVEAQRAPRAAFGLGSAEKLAVTLGRRVAGARAVRFRATEDLPPELALETGIDDAALPPSGRVEVATTVRVVRRGRCRLGPLHVRFAGPLGLAEREVRFDVPVELRALPRFAHGAAVARLLRRGLRLEQGLRRARRRGEGTSFESLREHVPGEDLRKVDWKASARHAKLIQRQYELERSQCLLLLVDCGRAMTAEVGGMTRLDHALDACLLLAQAAALRDDRIGLLAFSDTVERFVPPAKGRAAVESIVDAVFDLEPKLVESDYERAFAQLAARHRRRSLLVLFTDVLSRDASRIVADEMRRASRRHLPMAVTLRDADLDRVVRGVPATASAAYALAGAEEILVERESALHRMRRDGVIVVDVDPRHAATAAVDRYLDLKARLAL